MPQIILIRVLALRAQVHCGVNHSAVVLESGEVCTFGRGEDGQLGLGHKSSTATPTVVQQLPPVLVGMPPLPPAGGGGAAQSGAGLAREESGQ